MTPDPLALLDRQHARLQEQRGASFVHELKTFHGFLTTTGPTEVTAALAKLRAEAERVEREFTEHDEALVPRLVALKTKLVVQAPEADDSDVPRPQTDWRPPMEWASTLANFDQVASGGADRLAVRNGYDISTSGMLLRILEGRLNRLQFVKNPSEPDSLTADDNLRPDLNDLRRELRNLGDRHRHAANTFTNAVETHGGVQVQVLDWAVEEMNPEPALVESDEDEHAMMDQVFRRVMSGMHALEDASAGRSLSSTAQQALEYNTSRLKSAAEKVYEAVRLKVAMASAPSATTHDYGQRLKRWIISPGYQLIGGPSISGLITQLARTATKGVALFFALAILAALVPPALPGLPSFTYTRALAGFIVTACAAVVIALIVGSLAGAFLVFLLAMVSFSAGAYWGRHEAN